MGLFDKKGSSSKEELKDTLRRDPGVIPGTGGQRFSQEQREKIERNVFGSKYGSVISKDEYKRAVRNIEDERNKTQDPRRKAELSKEANYLRRVGGMEK